VGPDQAVTQTGESATQASLNLSFCDTAQMAFSHRVDAIRDARDAGDAKSRFIPPPAAAFSVAVTLGAVSLTYLAGPGRILKKVGTESRSH
jgi:hypothetical protein